MDKSFKASDFFSPFMALIATALLVQYIGRYYATHHLVVGHYFYLLWVILRIVIPTAVLILLKVPLTALGFGAPKIDPSFRSVLLVMGVVFLSAFAGIYFCQGYFNFYSGHFAKGGHGDMERFLNFMLFTASTLPGWEFLHRCFLLMGVRYVLAKRERLSLRHATLIAVAVCWVFEVIFHFTKPMLESAGLMIGSPLLSYIALRTDSIWIAFTGHLLVEILFIVFLIVR